MIRDSYSASRTEEYETAIAEPFLANSQPDGVFLLSNIDCTQPVVFCWDHNDLMEETASGDGTTHCTNGVIIHRRQSTAPHQTGCLLGEVPTFAAHPRHRRSIQCTAAQELNYVAGLRAGPQGGDHHYVVCGESLYLEESKQPDQLYILLQCPGDCSSKLGRVLGEAQTAPSWSAFNASVGDIPQCSTIGYLPVIPASPAEPATGHV